MGNINENGQRLLELCTYHDLFIANSYFRTKPQHTASWIHPRSKHWHQLDLNLFRRAALKNVLHTCSYHSADCNTDHSLVCCKIRLQPKRFHCTKKQGTPVLMSARCHNQTSGHNLQRLLRESSVPHSPKTLPERSGKFSETPCIAQPSLPSGEIPQTHDLFDAKSTEMRPVIEAKRTALIVYKQSPNEMNRQIPRAARSKVQQTARRCANEYWTQLSQDIQRAAITGNIRGMYDGIKKALGPIQSKTAPLESSSGEIIIDKGYQMERWVEHYSDLNSRENTVSPGKKLQEDIFVRRYFRGKLFSREDIFA